MKFSGKFLVSFFLFVVFSSSVFSSNVLVEDVFTDVDSNYKYRDELQTLYDNEIIQSNLDWKFNPYQVVKRDDFMWVAMEVTCEKCIFPHTDYNYIKFYSGKDTFWDLEENNENFYCIYEADNEEYFSEYSAGYECDDGTSQDWWIPFCVNDVVTRQEAIMVLMKSSNLISERTVLRVLQDIDSWSITENLSDDVSAKNSDGSANLYYPYLQKALDIELVEYSSNWGEKVYKLLEEDEWKLRAWEAITREELLYMAYIIYKLNACEDDKSWEIPSKINVYNSSCDESSVDCDLSDLNASDDTYDFGVDVSLDCSSGIDDSTWYSWWFVNIINWESFTKNWKYLNDVKFLNSGIWKVNLRVRDNCTNESEMYLYVGVWDDSMLSSMMKTSYINSSRWAEIEFKSVVSSGESPYEYAWDFGDGDDWIWKSVSHIYSLDWIYEVKLSVTDSNGVYGESNMFIEVSGSLDCSLDSDWDGQNNCEDECPLVLGSFLNKGCPIFYSNCDSSCSCPDWYTCDSNNTNTCGDNWFCIPDKQVSDSCLYLEGDNNIFGELVCKMESCDDNYLDFIADLRRCDEVYPAIVSLDGEDVYSSWGVWTSSGHVWVEKEVEEMEEEEE